MDQTPARQPLVSVRGLGKAFNGVPALRDISIDFEAGTVHALCGENGAGKSTLIEILAGNHAADEGIIQINGVPVALLSPHDALAQGIAVIHQEFSLVDELTVAENLLLGHEPRFGPWLDRRKLHRQAESLLERFGFDLPIRTRVGRLPTGARQLVEIAKALSREAKLLILDEPTAALTRPEAEKLFALIHDLRARGMAIVYVSHHLTEVLALADQVSVLRDGRLVETRPSSQFTTDTLTAAMVGDVVDIRASTPRTKSGPVVLAGERLEGSVIKDVSFSVASGEILGITGLAGAGHEELARMIFGVKQPTSGRLLWNGTPTRFRGPRDAIAAGIASIPADRRREGLLTTLDIERNLTITRLPVLARLGWIPRGRRRALASSLANEFEVAHARLSQPATTLSGGNQQKVVLGRWSSNQPRLVVYNDPTRGIDIKTREAIHRRIEQSAAEGTAVLLITSDTQELRRLADRVLILRRGRLVREAAMAEFDDQGLITAMMEAAHPEERTVSAEDRP